MARVAAVGRTSSERIANTRDTVQATASAATRATREAIAEHGVLGAGGRLASSAGDAASTFMGDVFVRGDLEAAGALQSGLFSAALPGAGYARATRGVPQGGTRQVTIAESHVGPAAIPNTSSASATRARIEANIAESAAARGASNFEIHSIIETIPRLDVAAPSNRAVVWSNARGGNLTLADDFIARNPGYLRLENTPGGQHLESLRLFERYPYEQAIQPWERLSSRYAHGASGQVTAFTQGASPTSLFQRIELPILQQNPNVTGIRYMPSPPVRMNP